MKVNKGYSKKLALTYNLLLLNVNAAVRPFGNLGANEQNPTFGASNRPYSWVQVQPANPNVDPKNLPGMVYLVFTYRRP
jgi:hypothetical protein